VLPALLFPPSFASTVLDFTVPTAEDITSARRAERKIVKKQKAQERADEKEKQALALAESRQGLPMSVSPSAQEEGGSSTPVVEPSSVASSVAETGIETEEVLREATEVALLEVRDATNVSTVIEQTEKNLAVAKEVLTKRKQGEEGESASLQSINTTITTSSTRPKIKVPNATLAAAKQEAKMASMELQVPNLEHTQLQREEAFFLVLCTGALEVVLPAPSTLSTSKSLVSTTGEKENSNAMAAQPQSIDLLALWDLFLRSSLISSSKMSALEAASAHIRPDNPFIVSYVVYHHYRSLGWVVRNGVKFCADWVLYKGADGVKDMRGGAGPVGGHAE
jgi:tRNA-splicing endonuclease subunit Sen2